MKKEKTKNNKNILFMAGAAASIVMIIIVLSFSISSVTKSASITGNSINLKETGQLSESSAKQEIEILLEKKCLEIIGNRSILDGLIAGELSGNGNAYLCINSEGKIFRSESPCK